MGGGPQVRVQVQVPAPARCGCRAGPSRRRASESPPARAAGQASAPSHDDPSAEVRRACHHSRGRPAARERCRKVVFPDRRPAASRGQYCPCPTPCPSFPHTRRHRRCRHSTPVRQGPAHAYSARESSPCRRGRRPVSSACRASPDCSTSPACRRTDSLPSPDPRTPRRACSSWPS